MKPRSVSCQRQPKLKENLDSFWPRARGQKESLALGAALYTLISLAYLTTNVWQRREPLVLGWSAVDRWIPFLDWTIWIYCSHFVLLAWAIWEVARAAAPRRLVPMAVAGGIATLCFWLTPTTLSGEWPWTPGPLTQPTFQLVSSMNTPANCLPSLHVALAALAAAAIRGVRPPLGVAAGLWAAAVAASTLTAKQHTAIDVPAGAALAWIAWRLTPLAAARK